MKEKTDPVEEIRPSKRLKFSDPVNHGHHGSPSSSPSTMEPSQPSPLDSVQPSPLMDVMETTREMSEKIEPDGEIKPSKRFESSGSMNAGLHEPNPSSPLAMKLSQSCPVDSVHLSPSMDAMEAIREMCEKIGPVEQIYLISFVENQLHKMNTPSEEGSSSSNVWMETVGNVTKLAAKTIDTISTEAEKLSESDAVKAIGSLTVRAMEGVGNEQCVLIGLCLAACAAQNYRSVSSTENECSQLLLIILQLAIDAKKYSRQQMPDERGKLYDAVGTIMEGAVICIDYMKSGTEYRFWSAKASAAQVEKTNQLLTDIALCSLRRHWDKDVFLSHSGKQKNFVRQLYVDLSREHISCFFDEDRNSLPLGERFPPLIFKAAEECRIAVMVLSKQFICSKWPMLELSAFFKAQKSGKNPNLKLLPIFFMISPNELKELSKIDNPEWQKLDVSYKTKVEWQDALKVVRSTNGLRFGEDDNEVALREEVTKEIRSHLPVTTKLTRRQSEIAWQQSILLNMPKSLVQYVCNDDFLDICWFFNGYVRRHVEYVVGEEEVKSLEEARLVTFSFIDAEDSVMLAGEERLSVYDIVKAKEISMSESTRFMDVESFCETPQDQTKLLLFNGVKGLWLQNGDYVLDLEGINLMRHSLRILHLGRGISTSAPTSIKFNELRYLNAYDYHGHLPVKVEEADMLRTYVGPIGPNGIRLNQLPKRLRRLHLSQPFLSEESSTFTQNDSVEELCLLENFTQLPEGLHQLRSLKILTLCASVNEEFPEQVCELSYLIKLSVSGWRLKRVPQSFGRLKGLTHLQISFCYELEELPSSFGELKALEYLSLKGCEKLKELPGGLDSLKHLDVTGCHKLKELPGGLDSLKYLDVTGCHKLRVELYETKQDLEIVRGIY